MSMTVEAAVEVMREAMGDAVKRHSHWYLAQSVLMILAGALALIYPAVSSVAVVLFLGWLMIISGILQGITLIDAHKVKGSLFLGPDSVGGAVCRCGRATPAQSMGRPSVAYASSDLVLHG